MTRPDRNGPPALRAEEQCIAYVEASADACYRITVPRTVLEGVMRGLIDKAPEQ